MYQASFLPVSNPCLPAFHARSNILAHAVNINETGHFETAHKEIALIGIDPILSALFRKSFYAMSADYFDCKRVADFGDLNQITLLDKAHLLCRIISDGICPILIGADIQFLAAIQDIWDSEMKPYRISLVSDSDLLLDELNPYSIYLKELHLLAIQRQHPKQHNAVFKDILRSVRLGEFRQKQSVAEPYIRRSDILYFHMQAIRASDAPANEQANPSGLFSEEACSVSRMAGLGDRLKLFAVSPWLAQHSMAALQAQLAAQMIWYFIEGFHLRKLDAHLSREALTQYSVELKDVDYVIRFYKSEHSGKWWFEEPIIDNEFSNQLIPCTYEEYLATARNQIPTRILDLIR